jgi:hypothetical protein
MTNQAAIYTLNPPQQGVHRAKVFMEDGRFWVMLLDDQGKCFVDPFGFKFYMDMIRPLSLPDTQYYPLVQKILNQYLDEFDPRPPPQQRTMNFDEPKKADDMV